MALDLAVYGPDSRDREGDGEGRVRGADISGKLDAQRILPLRLTRRA